MAFSKKLCLVQDMKDNLYCNMVAEVVKVFDSHTGVDLYVTDYTKHRDLFLYTDPNDPDTMGYSSSSNWPGPSGQFTIMIHLWDNQADAAREKGIKVGDIVVLQNVHIEYNMDRMEGGIHTDRDWRDKVSDSGV
jgi:protection-of-telomeres protein 1